MREKTIERKLVKAVRARGGICPKWTGWTGCPDRIILLPGAGIAFAEIKAPGKRPGPLQEARHRALRGLGFPVYVIDGADQIGPVLDGMGRFGWPTF